MCSFPEGDQELWPEFGKKGWPGMGCLPCCRLDLPEIPFKKRHRGYDDGRDTFASAFANFKTRSGSSKHRNLAEEILKVGHAKISAQVFRFFELASSTDNFNPDYLVGEGGLGRVYKGYIESIEKVVAVKKLYRKGVQESREFFTEVLLLSLVHHPNVIDLYGYCAEGDQRILVYEFMANGSLEDHLLDLPPDKEPLDWYTRMRIAEGAAKGLEYLHEFANPVVIYRDFKASNILLDEEFNPKLSDFGLATIGPTGGKDHVSTRVMGTYGYCAPEYASTGQLTVKSDVYSFGVVLLELITGRRAVDTSRHTEEQNLVSWAQPLYKDRKRFTLVADPMLRGKYPEKGLYQALAVAAMCIQEEAATRPLMGDVVSALEYLSKPRLDEEGPMDPSHSSGEHFQSAKTETGKRKRESYGIGEAKAPAT